MRTTGNLCQDLLEDGSLSVEVERQLIPVVEPWLPRLPPAPGHRSRTRAIIHVLRGSTDQAGPPSTEPTLTLGTVAAWVLADRERVILKGSAASCRGVADLSTLRSELYAQAERGGRGGGADAAADLYSMLTICAALTLGRLGRALLHSAGVVTPGGAGWLLVGDAHAGKSTTCMNLVAAGWDYLSDDQLILGRDAATGEIRIEGWLRAFHLDDGWGSGTPLHRRRAVDPATLGSGRWRRTAQLSGLLFPQVAADAPTTLTPVTQGDALSRLLRQTPWLLADLASAAATLELLRTAAGYPAFHLRLGLDSYRDVNQLLDCLQPLLESS